MDFSWQLLWLLRMWVFQGCFDGLCSYQADSETVLIVHWNLILHDFLNCFYFKQHSAQENLPLGKDACFKIGSSMVKNLLDTNEDKRAFIRLHTKQTNVKGCP